MHIELDNVSFLYLKTFKKTCNTQKMFAVCHIINQQGNVVIYICNFLQGAL